MPIADHVARIAVLICVFGALFMAAALLFIVMRRDRLEKGRRSRADLMLALTREIMGHLQDGEARPVFTRAKVRDKLKAVSRMIQLVRGEDQARLIAFAEREGLLDDAMRAVKKAGPREQVEAIRLLGSVGGERAVETLREALHRAKSLEVRLEAAGWLARLDALPDPRSLISDLALEEQQITPLHRALFSLLARNGPEQLVALAGMPLRPAIKALAVEALGWTEDYSTLRILAEASTDPNPPVRLASINAAARLGHPDSARWILPMLNDPVPPVRSRAITACVSIGIAEGLEPIRALRADPSPWVRLRAQQAEQLLAATP
ncbi:HEAT repeat domain-containing protein [Sphingobium bisphenolivorans]|uniref:HEAT repeat domain-containing protein n=1 Tax=Sphingobium bisphenolivorans TaxID=1335760 RepID=UPI0003A378A5|nr:HEAT repeat domain-containing protein [Sphingobium bisphenolivorans]